VLVRVPNDAQLLEGAADFILVTSWRDAQHLVRFSAANTVTFTVMTQHVCSTTARCCEQRVAPLSQPEKGHCHCQCIVRCSFGIGWEGPGRRGPLASYSRYLGTGLAPCEGNITDRVVHRA
jgi:hypothetical protein